MVFSAAIWWLIIGVVFILIEVMQVPGIGFLFAGLAALVVGGLVSSGLIAEGSTLIQFIWFFLFTALWAAILWVPMKRLRYKTSSESYKNIVGDIAVVIDGAIHKHSSGKVRWSGTIMKARISKDCDVEKIPDGAEVEIVDVAGSKLFIKPRNHSK